MAWSVLQSASGFGSSVSSETATFTTANLSAGSKIIAAISIGATSAAAISSVTATGGNTLTQIGAASQGNARIYLYAIDAAGSGGTSMVGTKPTITATFASAGGLGIVIQEVSGLLAGNTTAMADGTAGTLTGTAASTGSPTYSSSAANEYLVSCYADFGSGVTPAAAGGWTLDASSIRGSTESDCIIQYKNSTGGSESDGFTSADTGGWAITEVAFKLAASPAATPPPLVVPQAAVMQAANW